MSDEANVVRFPGHHWAHCERSCSGCMLCRGGLSLCKVCGGAEGELPTDCPGFWMRRILREEIYAGRLDYRHDVGWVQRPSKIWERVR